MKISRLQVITFIIAAGFVFWTGSFISLIFGMPERTLAFAEVKEDLPVAEAGAGFPSFVEVVKKEKPAVVNISTTKVIHKKGPGLSPFSGPNDPFREFFGDDFFYRFFGGIPQKEYKTQSLGSGFIIDENGYILTNNHVVENAEEIIVKLSDEREFKAEIVGRDPKTDIALIKIENHDHLPVVNIGDSDKIQVGEWVLAIGNPFGVGQTVTAGIVSATGREIGSGPYDDFIQTDASINPGNSGGPLFNTRGEVIGINSAIYTPSGGNVGIGFSIPINMAKRIIPQLKEKGSVTRGWLGVSLQQITKELAESFKLPSAKGALVGSVVKDSPAEKAGIKRGDVIIEFDGKKINKMRSLPSIVAMTPVGKKVKIKVIREGKVKTLKVKIEKMKDGELAKAGGPINNLGMSVQELTPDIAEQLGLETTEGVIVVRVERGSPSHRGGLRRGDVIIQINRHDIKNIDDYRSAMRKFKKGDTALFLIIRGSSSFYAAIRVD